MSLHRRTLPTLVIVEGATASQAIGDGGLDDAYSLGIWAPAATAGNVLPGIIHVNVHTNSAAATTTVGWATLFSGASIVFLATGSQVTLTNIVFGSLMLTCTNSAGTRLDFQVNKQIQV